MWLPNPSVSEVDEHASLLTHTLSTSALLNINMEERIPLSLIVRRPYCSLLASASPCVHVCLVLMHKLVSTLYAYSYYVGVFIARVCVGCSRAAVKAAVREMRGPPWPIKTTGLRALGPAIRAQHWRLFHLEALSVKWTFSLNWLCVCTQSQFRGKPNIW